MSSVVIEETKQYLVVDSTEETLEIVEETIGILEVGIQGPPGVSPAGSDKHFEAALNGETDITISHNLAKYPAISVFDSAGTEIEGEYRHLNNNSARLLFTSGFGGKVIFN